jgi:hypothetical protein
LHVQSAVCEPAQRVDINITDSKAGKSATSRYGGEGGIGAQLA